MHPLVPPLVSTLVSPLVSTLTFDKPDFGKMEKVVLILFVLLKLL